MGTPPELEIMNQKTNKIVVDKGQQIASLFVLVSISLSAQTTPQQNHKKG